MTPTYKDSILSYYQVCAGRDRCVIDLKNLFQSQPERALFETRWESFLNSDAANREILSRTENDLEYMTESIVPLVNDSKPSLMLLFGNPAPHSVRAGAMFSSEGSQREHRIWSFLADAGVLSFQQPHGARDYDITWRVKRLFSLEYESPFQVALTSFISLPSSASDPRWSGVAGVKKLFGAKAFAVLCDSEFNRLRVSLKKFMPINGIVVAFQKDAFNALRSAATLPYSLGACLAGSLIGSIKESPNIFLGAVPPTRLIRTSQARQAFLKVNKEAMKFILRQSPSIAYSAETLSTITQQEFF